MPDSRAGRQGGVGRTDTVEEEDQRRWRRLQRRGLEAPYVISENWVRASASPAKDLATECGPPKRARTPAQSHSVDCAVRIRSRLTC